MRARNSFARQLKLAVRESAIAVQEYAQDNHKYVSRTGALERAIREKVMHGGMRAKIYLASNEAPYAVFVHEGSRPHYIFPRHRKALRWVHGNQFAFAKRVYHPGYKGDPFLYNALDAQMPVIEDIFNRRVDKALIEIEATL